MEDILPAFNLSTADYTIIGFGNGLINKTWRISNVQDDYILQQINDAVFKNPVVISDNVTMIADYLEQHSSDFLFVRPVKTIYGKDFLFIKDKGYFRLFEYVSNSHAINTVENTSQAYEAARKFGQLTKLLSDFPIEQLHETIPDFHNLSLRYHQFEIALTSGNQTRIAGSSHCINAIARHKHIVDTYHKILNDPRFKTRVTHHDTKISNVLFDENDKALCVIDLDTTMPGYFISDLGDMLRTYLSPANEEEQDLDKIEIRQEYFESIMQGYLDEMYDELTQEEKRKLMYAGQFMMYMQALRFLTDYLLDDIYYGERYPGHNLRRAQNQIRLMELYNEKSSLLQQKLNGILTANA